MHEHKAIALAIQALEAEIKRLAVNANLEDAYHSGIPMCVEASRRRKELREAVKALRQPHQARLL